MSPQMNQPMLTAQVEPTPPVTITERLADEVRQLREVPGFQSAAVSRRDGLVIHHTLRTGREAASLCAMAAAMVGAARSTGDELKKATFIHGIIRYEDGLLIISEAGPEAILACLLSPDASLGLALLRTSKVAQRVTDALDEL